MLTGLILASQPVSRQSPDRVNLRITLLGDGGEKFQHGQGALDVVGAELLEVGMSLEGAHDSRDRETEVNRREEVKLGADGVVADPGVRRFGGASYTEVEYGKSRCVTYSSTIAPVAACPLGPARVYVFVPSEKPEIQSPA